MNIKKSISFVLPMFNEQDNIENTIKQAKALAPEITDGSAEIIVVDDASTDASADIVRKMSETDPAIKFFALEKNSMFGGAFAKGLKEASGEVILYIDSDMPVKAEDVKSSVPFIEENHIVTGYSCVKKGDTIIRKIISSIYNLLVQSIFGLNVKDINSGYKVIRKEVLDDIDFISRSPFIDVELFIYASKNGLKVKQYPLVFQSRVGGKSHIARLPVIWATFTDMIKVRIKLCRKNR